jgi:hypothetical protein
VAKCCGCSFDVLVSLVSKPDDGTLVPKPVAYMTFNFLTFILIKNLLAVRRTSLIQEYEQK